MSKISWPNAASRCPTKRSGCGASRSVQPTLAGSSVDRAGWATLGTWTRSSSPSRDGGTLAGVPSIKMATSSISSSSRGATAGFSRSLRRLDYLRSYGWQCEFTWGREVRGPDDLAGTIPGRASGRCPGFRRMTERRPLAAWQRRLPGPYRAVCTLETARSRPDRPPTRRVPRRSDNTRRSGTIPGHPASYQISPLLVGLSRGHTASRRRASAQ